MSTIHSKNIEEYTLLYKSENSSKSYEVRVKVQFIKKSLASIHKKGKILEIGYGTGDLLHEIYKSSFDSSIYGLEVVDEAEKLYKRRFPKDKSIYFHTADAEKKLPFKSNFFDLIVFSHVLEHIKKEDNFIKEIVRILKNDGIAIIAVPEWEGGENHLHYRQYNKKELVYFSKKYKLRLVSLKGDGYYINKLYYFMLHHLLKRNNKSYNPNYSASLDNPLRKTIKDVYYEIFVNMLLFLNKIDNFLFRHVDDHPMQWVAVYKKNENN